MADVDADALLAQALVRQSQGRHHCNSLSLCLANMLGLCCHSGQLSKLTFTNKHGKVQTGLMILTMKANPSARRSSSTSGEVMLLLASLAALTACLPCSCIKPWHPHIIYINRPYFQLHKHLQCFSGRTKQPRQATAPPAAAPLPAAAVAALQSSGNDRSTGAHDQVGLHHQVSAAAQQQHSLGSTSVKQKAGVAGSVPAADAVEAAAAAAVTNNAQQQPGQDDGSGQEQQEQGPSGRRKRKDCGKRREAGRPWSEAEEAAFLAGLEQHGRDWKAIADAVGTRDSRAVASHAQKHFIRLCLAGQALPNKVAESGRGYTLSGKLLDPASAAAQAYGFKEELIQREFLGRQQSPKKQQQQQLACKGIMGSMSGKADRLLVVANSRVLWLTGQHIGFPCHSLHALVLQG